MQERSGKREPLTLAAGEIASLFLDLGIQSLLCLKESPEIHFSQHCDHFLPVCVRLAHPQIFFHRSFKQITVMSHTGH